ncbi:pituitary tumor-transforming gene 1 protein-interacting protein-like [Babylonia areolata]|uniref:pituitary tumor-transforming gene 1 protein-interacting protein-like n=1 Tax=Babylonia areolata TaxID=304850 RepID=UPI003FD1867E
MGWLNVANLLCVILVLTGKQIAAVNNDTNETTTTSTNLTTNTTMNTTTQPSTTTPSTEELCAQHNTSCEDCLGVGGAKCLWCESNSRCMAYPAGSILPSKHLCALDEARWGVCWLNFQALIISMSVVGGIIILTIVCCVCCCCCCRGGNKAKYDKEEARYNNRTMERKAKNEERRAERKERLDEIRRKYGLMRDEPYQRFDE